MSVGALRGGLLARKAGMSRVYDDAGRAHAVTLLSLSDCRVAGVRTKERDGYEAVLVGEGERKAKRVKKPLRGMFKEGDAVPRAMREFRLLGSEGVEAGTKLSADWFREGDYVDVSGLSMGKGFAGVMKRHNFKGQPASHGAKKVHRQMGSTGQCQDPGRVFKGKKMPGRMGGVRRTTQNLRVMAVSVEKGYVAVRGSVPGPRGGLLEVRDTVKRERAEAEGK